MKILLVALLTSLLSSPSPTPGYCGVDAHYQCHRIGLAMSCGCVPNN